MYQLTRTVAIATVIAGLLLVVAGAAQAQLLLNLDAANPANSSTTWVDSSSSGYDFSVPAEVTYDDAGDRYAFPQTAGVHATGTGDESIFDFDTAQGTGATPWTVVSYFHHQGSGDRTPTLVGKYTNTGGEQGWKIMARHDNAGNNNNVDSTTESGIWSNRVYTRSAVPTPNESMIVWHNDGTGTVAGTSLYFNGSPTATAPSYQENNLSSSILNNEPLRIGGGIPTNAECGGDICFVQIWAGAESTLPGGSAAQLGGLTWNNGNPQAIVPEPTSMSLLLIGLIGLLGFGRRRRR